MINAADAPPARGLVGALRARPAECAFDPREPDVIASSPETSTWSGP
jgi:hypothetical protein